MTSGRPVAAAGQFTAKGGKIIKCSARSGHYAPLPRLMQQFSARIKELGYVGNGECNDWESLF